MSQPDNPNVSRKPAWKTFVRMVVYPCLGIGFVVAIFFHPRVQEEYYHYRRTNAEDEVTRDKFFTELRHTNPARERMFGYWEKRALELPTDKLGDYDDDGKWAWGALQPAIDGHYEAALVPAYVKALDDKDWRVRLNAAYAFGRMGTVAKAALPALIKALSDKNSFVGGHAARAIGNIGVVAKAAVPALIKALSDENFAVRLYTATALGKMGTAAKAAIPALKEALKDEKGYVRYAAKQAIKLITAPQVEEKSE